MTPIPQRWLPSRGRRRLVPTKDSGLRKKISHLARSTRLVWWSVANNDTLRSCSRAGRQGGRVAYTDMMAG